jgi:CheY-like chemotaxis protein
LTLLLGAAGYKVETAPDGETSLQAAEAFEPDVCILDINLPGMDGYELAKKLREQAAQFQPVLATVTGSTDPDHLDRAAEAGFDLHFEKPADPIEVAEQIGECVGR